MEQSKETGGRRSPANSATDRSSGDVGEEADGPFRCPPIQLQGYLSAPTSIPVSKSK